MTNFEYIYYLFVSISKDFQVQTCLLCWHYNIHSFLFSYYTPSIFAHLPAHFCGLYTHVALIITTTTSHDLLKRQQSNNTVGQRFNEDSAWPISWTFCSLRNSNETYPIWCVWYSILAWTILNVVIIMWYLRSDSRKTWNGWFVSRKFS